MSRAKEQVDINETIGEVVVLTESEMRTNWVMLQTELAGNLPPIMGDRVQLQQAVLNLILNGIEAMSTVQDTSARPRQTHRTERTMMRMRCRARLGDSGDGTKCPKSGRAGIFDAFHTTTG